MGLHKVKSPYYEAHRQLVQPDLISKLVSRASLLKSSKRVHEVSTHGNTTIILCEEDDLRD
jgi:hypothetical protein